MDSNLFWTVIDSTRGGTADTTQHAERLFDSLEAMPAAQLVGFHQRLADAHAHAGLYTQPLFSAGAYALGPMSEDVFADLRTHLIGRGRACVLAVSADVDALAEHLPADLDDLAGSQFLLEAASAAYVEVAGVPLEQTHPQLGAADFPAGPPRGRPIPDAELATRLPRLTRRYHRAPRWSWLR